MIPFRSAPIKLSDQALFEDNNLPNRVQLLRTGRFYYKGKPVEVAQEHFESMIKNFSEGVRGIDLMVDQKHDTEGEASAWFEELYTEKEGTQLWAKVRWTDVGKTAVLSERYRYLSADFDFEYRDNESLVDYGATLLGAGLTNRPVVKHMKPVMQLSESNQKYQEKEEMEELQKQIDALKALVEKLVSSAAEKPKLMEDDSAEMEAKEAAFAEKEVKFAEKEKKMGLEANFNKMFADGKVVEAQRESFLTGDMVKFSELATEMHAKNAGGQGKEKEEKEETKFTKETVETEISRLAEEKMASNTNVTFSEATQEVLIENKELSEVYNSIFA